MPYFIWTGIKLDGSSSKGRTRARSHEDLIALMSLNDVGLISSRAYDHRSWFSSIRNHEVQKFIYKLSLLLKAGVSLDDALSIASHQCNNTQLKAIIDDIIYDIHEGSSLSESVSYHECFSPIMGHMIFAGQESGDLGTALQRLFDYLDRRSVFISRIKKVAFIPLITFMFFLAIAIIILVYIVPAFAQMFLASHKVIPQSTQIVLALSSWLQGFGLLVLTGIGIAFAVIYKKLSQYERIKRMQSAFVIRIPWIGSLVKLINTKMFLETLWVMLEGGVDIQQACFCSLQAMSNAQLKEYMTDVYYGLERGMSLSGALQQYANQIVEPDVCAMIEVGEESGRLAYVIKSIVDDQQEQLNESLEYTTTMIQPLLMIFLGLLIAGLIFAVYVPIFDLSSVMN